MDKLISFFKKLRLGQILTTLLAVVVLFTSTACNSGTETGARPNNTPVQMGGANNPHKGGGDGYTNYKMSEDPTVNYRNEVNRNDRANDRAGVLEFKQLIAANNPVESGDSKLLYPGSNASNPNASDFGALDARQARDLGNPQIPAPRQSVINRNDPDVNILEKVGEAFKDSSNFVKDTADTAQEAPEMQINPGLRK